MHVQRRPLCALILAGGVSAQSLLGDLNPGFRESSANPTLLVPAGPSALVRTASPPRIWLTDGTATGTQRFDVPLATGRRTEAEIVDLDGTGNALFAGFDTVHGVELWRTGPALPQGQMVKDIAPGIDSSGPTGMFRLGSLVLFEAWDPVNGYELWRSDGTAAGTTLVADLNPGSASTAFSGPRVALGGALLFFAGAAQSGLWRSDGTAAGTTLLRPLASVAANMAVSTGSLTFFALSSNEVLRSDGTAAGTFPVFTATTGVYVTALGGLGARAVFAAYSGTAQSTVLWVTDGTAAGTVNYFSTGPNFYPAEFTPLGNRTYFAATSLTTGRELWVTDGTAAGTAEFADLSPGSASSGPRQLLASAGELFVFTSDRRAFRVDTLRVVHPVPAVAPKYAVRPVELRGAVLLVASPAGGINDELWWIRPVTGNTSLAVELDPSRTPLGSAPQEFAVNEAHSIAWFVADGTASFGSELWRSDGTAAGTRMVKDIGIRSRGYLTPVGDRLIAALDGILWTSDGTDPGTGVVGIPWVVLTQPGLLPAGRGVAFFASAGGSPGDIDVYGSDGTLAGTGRLHDFDQVMVSECVLAGDTTFFTGSERATGAELWATDGTVAGTRLVADLLPGAPSSVPSRITAQGRRVFFAVAQPAPALFVSDGSAAGTALLSSGEIRGIAADETGVVFLRDQEVWRSDGTPAGTRRLAAPGSALLSVAVSGGRWFAGVRRSPVLELWTGDGAAARICAVFPDASTTLARILPAGDAGQVLFVANLDGGLDYDLWTSDGSVVGTRPVARLGNDLTGARLRAARIGRQVLFAAEDLAHGEEPWSVALADLGAGLTAPYGSGCPGTPGVPQLFGDGLPAIGSQSFGLLVQQALPQSLALLALGADRSQLPLQGGCTLRVVPALFATAATSTSGVGRLALPLPFDPRLVGAGFYAQAFVADPQGAFLGVLAFTPGLDVLLRP